MFVQQILLGKGKAEPVVVVHDARVVAVPIQHITVPREVEPATAAQYAARAVCWASRVG